MNWSAMRVPEAGEHRLRVLPLVTVPLTPPLGPFDFRPERILAVAASADVFQHHLDARIDVGAQSRALTLIPIGRSKLTILGDNQIVTRSLRGVTVMRLFSRICPLVSIGRTSMSLSGHSVGYTIERRGISSTSIHQKKLSQGRMDSALISFGKKLRV